MPPGREVRPEMVITESLHAQNEMRGQEADSAEWVPVGREGLQEPWAFRDQGRRQQHEQCWEVATKEPSMTRLMNKNISVKGTRR